MRLRTHDDRIGDALSIIGALPSDEREDDRVIVSLPVGVSQVSKEAYAAVRGAVGDWRGTYWKKSTDGKRWQLRGVPRGLMPTGGQVDWCDAIGAGDYVTIQQGLSGAPVYKREVVTGRSGVQLLFQGGGKCSRREEVVEHLPFRLISPKVGVVRSLAELPGPRTEVTTALRAPRTAPRCAECVPSWRTIGEEPPPPPFMREDEARNRYVCDRGHSLSWNDFESSTKPSNDGWSFKANPNIAQAVMLKEVKITSRFSFKTMFGEQPFVTVQVNDRSTNEWLCSPSSLTQIPDVPF